MSRGFIAGLVVFFVLFSLLPTGYELINRNRLPPERSFELVHNFPTDYNFYLSRIRQGLEGRTTVVERYTSEPHEGSFIQVFYLGLGWLGRWWRVPGGHIGDIYHVARIVLAITLLGLIAQFCKKAFEKREVSSSGLTRGSSLLSKMDSSFRWNDKASILAFLLAVTASTWPKLVFYEGGWRFGGYMPWWSVMDSLQRITFIPHLLAGQSLTIALLLILTNETAAKKGGSAIFAGILGFVLGMVFPPGLLFVYATLCVLMVVGRKNIVQYAIFFFLSIPALGYLQLVTSFYPWKRLAQVDIIRPLPFAYSEYFKAVGPILPLGLVGLIAAFVKKEKAMALPVAWVAAWLVLLFAFRFVPQQSPLRFSEMIPHVPLAVLTAYFVSNIRVPFILRSSFFILIALGLGVMLSSYWWQRDFVDHKMRAAFPLVPAGSYVMYPLRDFLLAMDFLADNTPVDAVIFSETTAGNYIPARIGRRVYLGHDNTVAYEEKQVIAKEFFSGNMNTSQAKKILETNNLRYIFFGPQEKEDGGIEKLTTAYPFLIQVYTNPHVTIYRL